MPKDKAAAGVGFSIGGPAAESFIHAVKPLDSKDKGKAPDDRWAVTFVNMSEATRTATVRALCVG